MADTFATLEFTRDWRVNGTKDEGGFPTHESDEEQVRADMQALHEETREYINGTLRKAIQEVSDRQTVSFSHVPTIGANGNWQLWSEDQQKYVDSGISAWQGDVDEALATVAKEAAEAVTLESLGAYSKEETLSDATKELYGLDKEAKPDDVLEKIHEYVAEKAAYMVGQNATETTGKDCSEFCDITVEGSIGVEFLNSPTGNAGKETGHTFSAELSLTRLPDSARLVYLPNLQFSGAYEFSSSYASGVTIECEISLNGVPVQSWFSARAGFMSNGYTVDFPFAASAILVFGRPLKKGDVISVKGTCYYEYDAALTTARLTDIVVTPENARYVEV